MWQKKNNVLLFLVVGVCVAGTVANPPDGPTSPAAKAAITKRQLAIVEAELQFKKAKAAALKEEIDGLQIALKTSMLSGSLDEANTINTCIKQAQVSLESSAPPQISGTVWLWNLKAGATVSYRHDGTVTARDWGDAVGRWESIDEHTIRQYEPSGGTIRITLTNDGRFCLWIGETNNNQITVARRIQPPP